MPSVLGSGLALGVALGVASYTGESIFGVHDDALQVDQAARKEEIRRRFRRPLNETINEIGEGRGKAPPPEHLFSLTLDRYLWSWI